jgi:hypothetical protein
MAEYQLTATGAHVIRTIDHAIIPTGQGNTDWIEYQEWLTAGGVHDPVPPKISPALDSMGTGKTAAQILGV